MARHPDAEKLEELLVYVRQFQDLARTHGINDVFQDNGGKILQTLLFLGLKRGPGREGADALDDEGNEYELKSLNRNLVTGFSTHHHLNHEILVKYRAVHAWYFSVYEDIELKRIYRLTPQQLEFYFRAWEAKLNAGQAHINNPKIPLKFVQAEGKPVFPVAS